MISKTHRFHGRTSLSYVYRHGSIVRGPLFAVKSVLNPRRKTYRVAVVVGRKINKSAVARNRIRRRLYAAVRALSDDITQPYDIVLTVFQNSAQDAEPSVLARQVKKQLSEAGVLTKSFR